MDAQQDKWSDKASQNISNIKQAAEYQHRQHDVDVKWEARDPVHDQEAVVLPCGWPWTLPNSSLSCSPGVQHSIQLCLWPGQWAVSLYTAWQGEDWTWEIEKTEIYQISKKFILLWMRCFLNILGWISLLRRHLSSSSVSTPAPLTITGFDVEKINCIVAKLTERRRIRLCPSLKKDK